VPSLVARAAASGVGIYPIDPYYLKPPQRAGLILGYAALNERDIRAGVRAFAEVFDASATARQPLGRGQIHNQDPDGRVIPGQGIQTDPDPDARPGWITIPPPQPSPGGSIPLPKMDQSKGAAKGWR